MTISKKLSAKMRQYKLEHELTTVELAEELHLAVSTTQEYLNGNGKPRAETLELIAHRMGMSIEELLGGTTPDPIPESHPELKQTQILFYAAKQLASLPPELREKGIQLFRETVELWSQTK